jgi:hypothetical protein
MMKAKNVIASLAILSIILILIFILINRLRKEESFADEAAYKDTDVVSFAGGDGGHAHVTARNVAAVFNVLDERPEMPAEKAVVQVDGQELQFQMDKAGKRSALKPEKEEDGLTRQDMMGTSNTVRECKNADEDNMDKCCQDFVDAQTNLNYAQLDEFTGICTLSRTQCPAMAFTPGRMMDLRAGMTKLYDDLEDMNADYGANWTATPEEIVEVSDTGKTVSMSVDNPIQNDEGWSLVVSDAAEAAPAVSVYQTQNELQGANEDGIISFTDYDVGGAPAVFEVMDFRLQPYER